LAAIVFITIVASVMVKNTGAQSTASVGYASALTMHSTARSGVVATESFFLNNGANAATFIDSLLRHGGESFLFNSGATRKRLSASADQYFSSRLKAYENKLSADPPYLNAVFEVDAGESASGKAMRKAWAFYRLENLKSGGHAQTVNAVYSKGGIANADAGMTVSKGNATFEGRARFQNTGVSFDGTVYFGGGLTMGSSTVNAKFGDRVYSEGPDTFQCNNAVTFDGSAYFKSGAYFSAAAAFKDKAYFEETAHFQNHSPTFDEAVGFNGDVKDDIALNVMKNVYINGNLTGGKGINGAGPDDTLFRTSNFTGSVNATFTKDSTVASGINMSQALNTPKMTAGMNINARRDPELDIDKIPGNLIKSAADAMTGSAGGGNFDITKLNKAYADAANNNTLYNNEYLVVKVEKNIYINFTGNNPGTFNDKIIIIVENGATLNGSGGKFYNSGPNASTLLYAGSGNATLEQFGTSGDFRGLIYIDPANTANNSLKFAGDGKIIGAVHNFSSKPLGWNTGIGGKSIEVEFSQEALAGLSPLYKPTSASSGSNISLADGKTHIDPIPLGFYFP